MLKDEVVIPDAILQLVNKVESEQNLFFVILLIALMVLLPMILRFISKSKKENITREGHVLEAFKENAAVMSALKTAIDGLNITIGRTDDNIVRISDRLDSMSDTLAAANVLIEGVSEKTSILLADNKDVISEIKQAHTKLAML